MISYFKILCLDFIHTTPQLFWDQSHFPDHPTFCSFFCNLSRWICIDLIFMDMWPSTSVWWLFLPQNQRSANKSMAKRESSWPASLSCCGLVWLCFAWILVCCHNYWSSCSVQETLFLHRHPVPLALNGLFITISQRFLSLGKRDCSVYILLMAEHFPVSYSLHFGQFGISVFINIYWKQKLLWWGFKDIHCWFNKKSLRISVIWYLWIKW